MSASESNGPELLRRELLDEGRRQAEELLQQARGTAARLVAKAEQDAAQARQEKLDGARAEAKRRQESILATVSVETNRMRLARIEEFLQQIHGSARQQLENAPAPVRREAVAELATRALRAMDGTRFVIRLAQADVQAWGDHLAQEIQLRAPERGVELRAEVDAMLRPGSCLLADEAGHQSWEIGLPARLERFWPELRRQIASQLGLVDKPEHKADDL